MNEKREKGKQQQINKEKKEQRKKKDNKQDGESMKRNISHSASKY